MADSGIAPLLRPFIRFSNLHVWRFRNPRFSSSRSPLLHFSSLRCTTVASSLKVIQLNRQRFSLQINAVSRERDGNRRIERVKRSKKRRELWEELFEDNIEEDDDDGGVGFDLWKILEEIVDNVWILKAFRSYGYLLPFIILSLFFATGPKAFLVSLGVAVVPSLSFVAFQKLTGWDSKRKQTSIANQFVTDEEEEERRSNVQYNPSSQVKRASARTASKFGGWDELDGLGSTIPVQPRNEPIRKRKRVIRRRESREPLLLRSLVSLFPFLSSLTNMLKK